MGTKGRVVTVAALFAEYDQDGGADRPPLVVQTHIGYAALKAVVCHRTSKPVYRVTVTDGRHVDVTEDHSIAVLVDGKLAFTRPMDLVVGTSVIATRSVY
jgi:intein/homing endonuclease